MNGIPDPCIVEIVEKARLGHPASQYPVPNEVRVNGVPLLIAEHGVKIHEVTIPGNDRVLVTLTLICKRVVIEGEDG